MTEMIGKEAIEWLDGWFGSASKVISPNFDARPVDAEISALIIHSISLPPGEYGGHYVEDFFQNKLEIERHTYFAQIKDLCVSSHFYIRRDGGLVQFVSVDDRAWHAGESKFDGKTRVNDFSVGIELEGLDSDDYESKQYEVLARLTRALMQYCPHLDASRIVGHSDIAPTRKTDPGPWFDWDKYWDLLA